MKVYVVSDIHLEIKEKFRKKLVISGDPEAYLVLAGDIGNPFQKSYASFLYEQADKFKKVFVLAGNHEFYGNSITSATFQIEKVCSKFPEKLIFLNNNEYVIDETYIILGTTLWSEITPVQEKYVKEYLNDFYSIKDFTIKTYKTLHQESVEFLKTALEKNKDKKVIVCTHHAPTYNGTSAKEYEYSCITSAFASDLDYLIYRPVVAWVAAHSHHSYNQIINGIQVCSNQLGYPGEGVKFDPGFYIEI